MQKNNLKIFKALIFVFGLIVIACAWAFAPKKDDAEIWRDTYMWISIMAAYIALFCPVLFFPKDKDSSGGVFVSGGMYFSVCIGFISASLVLAYLVKTAFFATLYLPLVIQGALLFFLLIEIYLCAMTSTHISSVAAREQQKLSSITEIKNIAQQLSIRASGLGQENEALKKSLEQISNDLRYFSPSTNSMALDLESKICVLLKEIFTDPIFNSGEASNMNAVKKAEEVSLLMKQRKAIY